MGSEHEGPVADAPEISQPEAGSDSGDPVPRRRGRKHAAAQRVMRWAGAGVLSVLLFATVMVQSGRGQRMLLDGVLSRAEDALLGTLEVQGVRSGTLLTGATLTNVTLTAENHRRLLTADSIQLRYSPVALFTGAPEVSSLVVWGLDLEISRLASEVRVNITRLLRPRVDSVGVDSVSGGPTEPIRFGRIGVREGVVQILHPASEDGRGPTVESPDGEGRLGRLAFEAIDFDLEDVELDLSGGDEYLRARLASLSMDAAILAEPLRVDEAFGELTFGRGGIRVESGAFRLPGSLLRGDLSVGPREGGDVWIFESAAETDGAGDLADFAWIDPRIPAGSFRGAASVRVDGDVEVRFQDFEMQVEESTLTATGTARFGRELVFEDLDLTASPVNIDRIEPWVPREAPLNGWLSGEVRINGTLARTVAKGRLTLVPSGYGGGATTADFSGTLFSGVNPGASGFEARMNPVNYELVEAFFPAILMEGTGTLNLDISGRVDDALRFVADATHRTDGLMESRAIARGAVRRTDPGEWILDVQGDLAPLSLGMFFAMSPDVDLGGTLTGTWRAEGRLRDVSIRADLDAADGRVLFDGVFDMRRPGSFYRFDATAEEISLSTITGRLPAPSFWSGGLSMEGRGVRLDSMDAAATLTSTRARIGGLHVDTVTAHMRASAGILTVDSLDALLGGVRLTGNGRLGMAAPLDGEAHLDFSTESLAGLRPLLLGDTVIAKDTLTAIEATLLAWDGVDVDALPDTIDVRMHGVANGSVRLVGSVDALDVELTMDVRQAIYGHNQADSALLRMTARDLPALDGAWDIVLDMHGVEWEGRSFTSAHFDGDMISRAGAAFLDVVRGPGEELQGRGQFDFDSLGGGLALEEVTASVDSLVYSLARPTELRWDRTSLVVDDLEITRPGDDPMRLTAAGSLSRSGTSDFDLVVEGLHLGRVARMLEMDDWTVGGHADFTLSVDGVAEDPAISAQWAIEDPVLQDVQLSRLAGELTYAGQETQVATSAWSGDHEVFTVSGRVPLDLALSEVLDRTPPRVMELDVRADSLDASLALAYFQVLEDVVGIVDGSVTVRGTLDAPRPDGEMTLAGGAWSIEALGVRHADVTGALTLNPDRTVTVDLSSSATGQSTVGGTVTLVPLRNPGLDLSFAFSNFQAVNRLDMEGRISGDLLLRGPFGRPRVTGALQVDAGTLFVDEFARNAEVVDLSDPRLFGADTTVFETQSLIRDIQNPFLQSLTVEVDLSVPRDTWMRSEEMSIEMGGDLFVRYDRIQRDIVLVGELEALRGSYSVLGRTFDVTGGTVGFAGIPGVNPVLDIQAMSRIRRRGVEPLEVNATVEGTLTLPRVTLATEEAGVAESDLISYLIFGRSSSELATGQQSFLAGAAGSVAGAATGAITTLVSGAVASQLGAALSQGIGVDYLSITQAGNIGFASGITNSQIEIGQYVGQDAFIVLVFRPLQARQSGGSPFGGARLEWALNDDYTVEGFFEDRFLRSGSIGLSGLGIAPSQILGVFIFREWGY